MCHFPSSSKHGTTWWYNTELTIILDYNIETLKKKQFLSSLFSEASKEDIEVRQTFFINSTQSFLLQDLKKKFLYLQNLHMHSEISLPSIIYYEKKYIFVVLKVCCNLLDMIQIFLNKKSASKTQIQRRFNHLWLSWFFYYVDYYWRLWKY